MTADTRVASNRLHCVFSNLAYALISVPVRTAAGVASGVSEGRPVRAIAGAVDGLVVGLPVAVCCAFEAVANLFNRAPYKVPKTYTWMMTPPKDKRNNRADDDPTSSVRL